LQKLVQHLFETHAESLSSVGFVMVIFRVDKFIFQQQNSTFLSFGFWLGFGKFLFCGELAGFPLRR
jgi:hypothetical protein